MKYEVTNEEFLIIPPELVHDPLHPRSFIGWVDKTYYVLYKAAVGRREGDWGFNYPMSGPPDFIGTLEECLQKWEEVKKYGV